MKPNKATAYHEAGHAFADWYFGYRLKKATIVPNDDAAGSVESKTGLHFRSLEYDRPTGARIGRLHEKVVSLLAGDVAQRRYCARSVRSYHASSDRQQVADLLFTCTQKRSCPTLSATLKRRQ
jgi:ATP-dependent Zn protease